ncbi:hypothetical protein B8b_011 [Pseudoalteromonas phage B8b]|uniref:Uncharacterized protein n=1 Tax=Pseudoalteromonas phage B8b TaxID=1506997 RepID=A0A076G7J7_9CAUD|nr:hypothetical protein B8b_011 [Pseudoalteromonas phage B8b]|tara:strand:+ start:143 stop:379 length:237 start_codon:yes stop_codon:yes gene_type:complete
MSRLEKIRKAVFNIDRVAIIVERKQRLSNLVDEYGLEEVAAATCLNVSTIKQYLSSKYSTIGLEPLTQAENIFKKLTR